MPAVYGGGYIMARSFRPLCGTVMALSFAGPLFAVGPSVIYTEAVGSPTSLVPGAVGPLFRS